MSICFDKIFRAIIQIAIPLVLTTSAGNAYSTPDTDKTSQSKTQFTDLEKNWLLQHPVLHVASSSAWAPISYLGDDKAFHGIAVDYLEQLESKLGVRFVFIEANDKHLASDADLISALANPTTNTPPGFTATARPFLRTPLGIYINKESRGIHSLQDLHGKRVAVFQSKLAAELLAKDHPQITLVKTDIADEALEAVVSGKVDAYVGNTSVVSYVIGNQGFSTVKLGGLTPYYSELHMAVRSNEPLLLSAFQKALNAMSESDKNQIKQKWVLVTYDVQTDYRLLAAASALISIFAFWGISLARQIRRREKAEVEIGKAHRMLQMVLDNAPIGVFWQGTDGRYLGCNRIFVGMLSLDNPDQIVGKTDADITTGIQPGQFHANNKLALDEESPMKLGEEQIVLSNGKSIWVKTNRAPLKDEDNHVIGLLVTIEDISSLRDSEIRAGAIMEASLDCLITIDKEGRIIEFNPSAESTFGYLKNEVLGNSMAELIIPVAHRKGHHEGLNGYLATGKGPILHKRIEITALRKSGEEFPVELTVVPFETGGHPYFLGSLRDITEQKQLAREQQTIKTLMESLLSEMKMMQAAMDEHSIVSVTNLQGVITYANQKFADISGYHVDELIGSNHRIIKSGLHSQSFYQDMWETISSGKIWHGVIANKTKQGKTYWVASTIVPMLDVNGLPIKYIASRTDITEQHLLEEKLRFSIEREQNIGSEIQQTLLYGELPTISGTDSYIYNQASLGVDGDFFDTFTFSPTIFDIVIGDVMGKGVSAALIAAAVKQKTSRILAERLLNSLSDLPSPAEVVNSLHRFISPRLIRLERFVTLAYCRFDLSHKTMTITDAGHNCTIHATASGTYNCQFGDNLPIGVHSAEIYRQHEIKLSEGDLIVMYSDGVTEARNESGDFFGNERLLALVADMHQHAIPARIACDLVERELKIFKKSAKQSDDRTVLVIRIEAENSKSCSEKLKWESSEIARVRHSVTDFCFLAGLGEDWIQRLVLAAVETFTNILRHANSATEQPNIHMSINCFEDNLEVDFYYPGEVFVPSDIQPDFSGCEEGGYGLFIIKRSVDEVVYDVPLQGICRIRLIKHKHITIANESG